MEEVLFHYLCITYSPETFTFKGKENSEDTLISDNVAADREQYLIISACLLLETPPRLDLPSSLLQCTY